MSRFEPRRVGRAVADRICAWWFSIDRGWRATAIGIGLVLVVAVGSP
ncbi:hypothetical protein ACFQPA_13065 [Halomarina halobia]|uniref:ABC transporter permease n=1 Tax=Halomarina halobia TaxID=3033386 RepID=A0ABD6A9Y7_9EURY|nr:hypothetical protein [Halomarina sp. PSR21]